MKHFLIKNWPVGSFVHLVPSAGVGCQLRSELVVWGEPPNLSGPQFPILK